MKRLEMLRRAKRYAHECVDGNAALTTGEHSGLSTMSDGRAVASLAATILENARETALEEANNV